MATKPTFDGTLTCALGVTDLDKAIEWYREVLGCELIYRVDDLGWCELATAVTKVTIGLSEVEHVPHGGGATLTFGVADVDVERRTLEARGVRFEGPTQTHEGMVRLATFYDLDDNPFMLAQDLQRGAP